MTTNIPCCLGSVATKDHVSMLGKPDTECYPSSGLCWASTKQNVLYRDTEEVLISGQNTPFCWNKGKYPQLAPCPSSSSSRGLRRGQSRDQHVTKTSISQPNNIYVQWHFMRGWDGNLPEIGLKFAFNLACSYQPRNIFLAVHIKRNSSLLFQPKSCYHG